MEATAVLVLTPFSVQSLRLVAEVEHLGVLLEPQEQAAQAAAHPQKEPLVLEQVVKETMALRVQAQAATTVQVAVVARALLVLLAVHLLAVMVAQVKHQQFLAHP